MAVIVVIYKRRFLSMELGCHKDQIILLQTPTPTGKSNFRNFDKTNHPAVRVKPGASVPLTRASGATLGLETHLAVISQSELRIINT